MWLAQPRGSQNEFEVARSHLAPDREYTRASLTPVLLVSPSRLLLQFFRLKSVSDWKTNTQNF